MAGSGLDDVIGPLERLPLAAMLTELTNRRVVAVNDRAAALLGIPASEIVDVDVLVLIQPDQRDAVRAAYAAMAGRAIDGYQVRRTFLTPGGKQLQLSVWGWRVESDGGLYGLWVLVPGSEPTGTLEMVMGTGTAVLAVTDHNWRIEYMSADADLLGARGADLRGFPLLGLVHPSSAATFLAAAARTATQHVAVTVVLRMTCGEDCWVDRCCLILRMDEHEPPRLGVVITECPPTAPERSSGDRLHDQVRHCALEARARKSLGTLPALSVLPIGNELSARQSEIVTRLVGGQRVPEIAASMFLSQSTVRNHLVAIYRKFGVHSQTELLAALLRASASPDR